MIRAITIRNIALIEQLSIQLHGGMNVLSGETGAGKSIIIDAVSLILGGRADKDLIRSGCDKASVEAEFFIEDNTLFNTFLERVDIESMGDTAILYREMSLNGRNICRINGVAVTLSMMKEASANLLNLHGQSEHQFLADSERHLTYLDMMGDSAHHRLIEKTKEAYQKFIENHRYYAKMVKMNETRNQRIENVKVSLQEIVKADIHPGDEQKYSEKIRTLRKSSRIQNNIKHSISLLGNGEEESGAIRNIQTASRELRALGGEDTCFTALADRCDGVYYSLEDILYELSHLSEKYDYNQGALEEAESKLDNLRRLSRKLGLTEENITIRREELEKEYKDLINLEKEIEITGAEHKKMLAAYRNTSKRQ